MEILSTCLVKNRSSVLKPLSGLHVCQLYSCHQRSCHVYCQCFISGCDAKIPWQTQLRRERVHSRSQSQGMLHHSREITALRAWENWLLYIHSQKQVERNELMYTHGGQLIFCIQSRAQSLTWWHPHSGWVFPHQSTQVRKSPTGVPTRPTQSREFLIDTSLHMILHCVRLTKLTIPRTPHHTPRGDKKRSLPQGSQMLTTSMLS